MTHLTTTRMGHVVHPLVGNVYLKKDFGSRDPRHPDDVLVIETQFPVGHGNARDFQSCLTDLLSDLPDLQREAEAKIGRFDRVDIRYMH